MGDMLRCVHRDHAGSIRDIAANPFNEDICLTASDDGTIIRHDWRIGESGTPIILGPPSGFTGVRYHPASDNLIATSAASGHVALRDLRMSTLTHSGTVMHYSTILSKPPDRLSNPEACSISFDREGSRLAVNVLNFYPVIYGLSDPSPLAVLTADFLPDGSVIPEGERTYTNRATELKRGSFGSLGSDDEQYYTSGSDDFRAYVWKIPPVEVLKEQRQTIDADRWKTLSEDVIGNVHRSLASFNAKCVHPKEGLTPCLPPHRSIINTSLFHPTLPHIVTAGVESGILIHSPFPTAPFSQRLERTDLAVREPSEANERGARIYASSLVSSNATADEAENDDHVIALFDE
ncbi:WD40 repeat-like protein [Sistotremastrum suecicum HHB10207 ss-3]|uniref:WD40 repeat-like protein n=1 Tax=Sistotremastrum suecicum HHB10207 ss-3 TaxID=1314776 RepID=A0A166JCK8_9AGAM|nr:WD40 repeat-like protein [Sistotremastrum suecicum HHB10207 ss-3]